MTWNTSGGWHMRSDERLAFGLARDSGLILFRPISGMCHGGGVDERLGDIAATPPVANHPTSPGGTVVT